MEDGAPAGAERAAKAGYTVLDYSIYMVHSILFQFFRTRQGVAVSLSPVYSLQQNIPIKIE